MYPDYPLTGLNQVKISREKPGLQEYLFNMGGPMSRTRSEHIQSSLLGTGSGPIKCPLVTCLGLDFEEMPPLQTIHNLLVLEGYKNPEELRRDFQQLNRRLICHSFLNPNRLQVKTASRSAILAQAVLLGLCTSTFFDPDRPVIWTNSSLTRCLDLYDMKGFYG